MQVLCYNLFRQHEVANVYKILIVIDSHLHVRGVSGK